MATYSKSFARRRGRFASQMQTVRTPFPFRQFPPISAPLTQFLPFSHYTTARDQPIVYASPGFVELTGYPVAEILGRNCRFMQGVGTDRAEAAKLRLGIEQGKEASATLLNYRKDGSTFWNYIQVAPMVDHKGNTALIVGVQCEVPVPPGQSGGVTDLKDMASKHSQQVVNNVSGSNTSGSDDGQQGRGGQSNSNSDQGSDDGLGFMVNGSDDGFGSSFSLQREDLVWALGVRSSPDDLTENS